MKLSRRNTLKAGLAAALICGITTSFAVAQTISEIKEKGSISIGMLVDFPPLGFINADNVPDGYDADVAKLLAEKMGVELNIVQVTGPNRIPYLLSGQADLLIASLAYTPKRAEKVDFSNPYGALRLGVFGRVDKDMSTYDKLIDYKVGVTRASGQDTTLSPLVPEGTEMRRFDDDVSAVQALLSGQVDVLGVSNIAMKQIREMAPGRFEEKIEMKRFQLSLGTRPGADEILAYVNTFLAEVTTSGQLEELHQKWFGEGLPTFNPLGQ
ncbi:MAG: transporter substrate-binding domain-containing protein [Paracoccaceae bacterium]